MACKEKWLCWNCPWETEREGKIKPKEHHQMIFELVYMEKNIDHFSLALYFLILYSFWHTFLTPSFLVTFSFILDCFLVSIYRSAIDDSILGCKNRLSCLHFPRRYFIKIRTSRYGCSSCAVKLHRCNLARCCFFRSKSPLLTAPQRKKKRVWWG